MGSSNENSAYGPVAQPMGPTAGCPGGSSGGSAAAVAGRLAPWALGTDTGRLDPPAGGAVRDRRPEADLRGVSRYGMIAFASSLDQCGPLTRDVTDAALLLRHLQGPTRWTRPASGSRPGVELPSRTDLKGLRVGVARDFSHEAEGVEPGVADGVRRAASTSIRELGAEVGECELPHAEHGISAYYVLAPGRGVVEPRPLRRRPLRHARRTSPTTSPRCTRPPGPPASAPRSSAGSCSAPTRSPPATTTPTTGAPSGCARRSPTTSAPRSSRST